MSRDLDKEISTAHSFVPAARTSTANGTGVDLVGYDKAAVVVSAGVVTDGTHTLSLEESDDNSSFTAVAAGNLSGSFTALTSGAGGSATQEVGYLGTKRYIRAVTTVTGSPSTGGVYSVIVIRAGARTAPV
jgi:hypothetical protein